MIKRFAIATDPLSEDEVQKLKDALASAGWWHWLPNFWLVRTSNEATTVVSIRNTINKINGTVRAVVLEVTPVTWAALSKKNAAGREMSDWISETWDKNS